MNWLIEVGVSSTARESSPMLQFKKWGQKVIIVDKSFPYFHWLAGADAYDHAFAEASSEEKQLIRLTAPELAREYQNAKIARDDYRCLLIEHYLGLRLVMLQVRATSKSSWLNFFGVFVSILLGFALGKIHP